MQSRKRDRLSHMITQSKVKYKLKWNVPISDVEIVEYGTGVNVLANSYRTTITQSKGGEKMLLLNFTSKEFKSCKPRNEWKGVLQRNGLRHASRKGYM